MQTVAQTTTPALPRPTRDRWLQGMLATGATLWTPATPVQAAPQYTTRVYYAAFHGVPGLAVRTTDGTAYFCAETTHAWTTLVDEDAPTLVLHGRLDLIQEQRTIDNLHGTLYQRIDARNSEHAKAA